jgi:hypothetical protein
MRYKDRRAARLRTADRRAGSPAPARGARAQTIAWALATACSSLVVAIGVERKVTWYLAVDQYGYLTFANDLVRGKVFHDWPLLGAHRLAPPDRIDVLSQTYVYDHGALYCRYAPGFPLILAAWIRLFGENAVHALNPLVFLALLASPSRIRHARSATAGARSSAPRSSCSVRRSCTSGRSRWCAISRRTSRASRASFCCCRSPRPVR